MKLIRLKDIMTEYTDSEHGLSINEIIKKLADYDISADRKSLYDDLESLRELGLDIVGEKQGRSYVYKVVGRDFELAELKLLVDSIQASKFITEKKSKSLISKLEKLCSAYEASQLHRQVTVSGRIKAMNENIYYNVDLIHNAINTDSRISFLYYRWNINKELEVRKNGNAYNISPFSLCWADENYYLLGFDSDSGSIRHYRVDKMRSLKLLDVQREGKEAFKTFDMAAFSRQSFGMFGGELKNVRLRLKNQLIGVILDRFGRDIIIIPDGPEHFIVNVEAVISDQFFGWLFGLGEGVSITHPKEVAQQLKQRARALLDS